MGPPYRGFHAFLAHGSTAPRPEFSRFLYRVTTEFVAQRSDDFRGEGGGLPRTEAREKRECDHWRRDIEIDGLLHCPAPFAGVLDVSAQIFQVDILLESRL